MVLLLYECIEPLAAPFAACRKQKGMWCSHCKSTRHHDVVHQQTHHWADLPPQGNLVARVQQ